MTKWYVYIAATVDRSAIKIGASQDPRFRMVRLKDDIKREVELLAYAPGRMRDERVLLAKFAAYHSHGEWFHPAPEIFALAELIAGTGELPEDCRAKDGEIVHFPGKKLSRVRWSAESRKNASKSHLERWAKIRAKRAAGAA